MEFKLGEMYAGYRFLDVLKRSKNGVEYWVQNTCTQRLEVLRTLPQGAQNDQEQTERFLREMRVRAQLVHPNIVTLFSAFELEHQLVMTTELVDGITLAERLKDGPLAVPEAISLARQALSAIGFAHQQRVVHRNISPENIIITYEGVVKLNDFALAKSASSPKLTQVGAVLGNVKYIAPEQIKGVTEADGRSDLYSMGVVLYEIVSGRPPFDSRSQFELMAAHVGEAPAPPTTLNPDIPVALEAVILHALAKDPAERYQTAMEFDHALAAALATSSPSAEPAAAAATPQQKETARTNSVEAGRQPRVGTGLEEQTEAAIHQQAAAVMPGAPESGSDAIEQQSIPNLRSDLDLGAGGMEGPAIEASSAGGPEVKGAGAVVAPQPSGVSGPDIVAGSLSPLFATAGGTRAAAVPWLLYSGAAAVCVGVAATVFWLVGR